MPTGTHAAVAADRVLGTPLLLPGTKRYTFEKFTKCTARIHCRSVTSDRRHKEGKGLRCYPGVKQLHD